MEIKAKPGDWIQTRRHGLRKIESPDKSLEIGLCYFAYNRYWPIGDNPEIVPMTMIYFWACVKFDQIKYRHLEEIPQDQTFNVAKEIFDAGLNVMIHHSNPTEWVLYVDDKKFQQR